MADNSIITRARRINLTRITSGAVDTIPKVAFIALGNAGVDGSGTVIPPDETQTKLNNEMGRYPVEDPEYPVETTARYTATVPKSELVGVAISEMALVDEAGALCAIRNTLPKIKDSDEEFTFVFDDEF